MRISDLSSYVCSSDLVLPAAFDFLQQVILHLPYCVAAHFPIIGVQHFLFPFQELRHAVLWQTKQIEDDIDRIFLRKFVHEVPLTAILECGNQVASALANLKFGRASSRDRVCTFVLISVVAVTLKNTNNHTL